MDGFSLRFFVCIFFCRPGGDHYETGKRLEFMAFPGLVYSHLSLGISDQKELSMWEKTAQMS